MVDTMTNMAIDPALLPDALKAEMSIKPLWLVVFGLLLVVLGAIAFMSVVTATIVSVYFVAFSMVMAGSAEITLGLQSRSSRTTWTWVVLGILYVIAGFFAFFNPLLAAGVLTLLLGASLVSAGFVRLFLAFQMRSDRQWWWLALSAGVTTRLGVTVLAQWPASSLYILGIFLSFDLIFAGLCWAAIGTTMMSINDAAATST
jgi:uncharacterized membrane protein HdeD (DUF308 family)